MPIVSIIIVSWNVCDLLHECLESVMEGQPALGSSGDIEVIVVDSGSTDGTPAMVRRDFPSVRLVEPGKNVGFSKGNNLGMQAGSGRYFFLLNPDTRLIGTALSLMINYMDAHPEVGVLGPQLLNDDGSVQSSRRRFPTLWTGIFESTWLQPFAPPGVLTRYYMLDHPDQEPVRADWVVGAAMLVRREVFEQTGGFDEGFFMYSEELDWQKRIRERGWEVIYYPQARIIHYGGKASEQVITERHIRYQTSKVRYFRKHHGAGSATLIRAVLLANYAWQLLLESAKWLLGHKREMRRARVLAYRQVLRTGLKG